MILIGHVQSFTKESQNGFIYFSWCPDSRSGDPASCQASTMFLKIMPMGHRTFTLGSGKNQLVHFAFSRDIVVLLPIWAHIGWYWCTNPNRMEWTALNGPHWFIPTLLFWKSTFQTDFPSQLVFFRKRFVITNKWYLTLLFHYPCSPAPTGKGCLWLKPTFSKSNIRDILQET